MQKILSCFLTIAVDPLRGSTIYGWYGEDSRWIPRQILESVWYPKCLIILSDRLYLKYVLYRLTSLYVHYTNNWCMQFESTLERKRIGFFFFNLFNEKYFTCWKYTLVNFDSHFLKSEKQRNWLLTNSVRNCIWHIF